MEHGDIIAYLYPHGAGITGRRALKVIEANPRHTSALIQDRYDRYDRESTEPLETPAISALDYLPCLAIRFSDIPRTDKGLVFGFNQKCDIVLSIKGISNVHFSLTFDNLNRPIIRDLNSLNGTEVTYNSKGQGTRRNFQWIIGGHPIPKKRIIIVTVPNLVSFQIIVPFHKIESPAYIDAVYKFNQGTATAESLINDLGLFNTSTRPQTGTQTPGTGDIHLRKELGRGHFGVVTYLWNVSTGDERAVKSPTLEAIRKGLADNIACEARLVMQLSHPHIVRFIGFHPTPQPELHLEYMPYGSLYDHDDISYDETLAIIHQCLSALVYLHSNEKPITHRDIKPSNILIKYRCEGQIIVKLGDFGISRHGAELTSFCGTDLYIAPEMYSSTRLRPRAKVAMGYTMLVDIWSLGVVGFGLVYGLPRRKAKGLAWCEMIARALRGEVRERPTGLGSFLIDCMVILSPESRHSASSCYSSLDNLLRTGNDSYNISTPASCPGTEDQTTLKYISQNYDDADIATMIHQSSVQIERAESSYYVSSGAPKPRSYPTSSSKRVGSRAPRPEPYPTSKRVRSGAPQPDSYPIAFFDRSGAPPPDSNAPLSNQRGHEMTEFLNRPLDHCNSFLVGSSLAAQMRGDISEDWESPTFASSSQHQIASVGSVTRRGSRGTRSSISWGGDAGWHIASGIGGFEGANTLDAEDYDEREMAILLLQEIGPGR